MSLVFFLGNCSDVLASPSGAPHVLERFQTTIAGVIGFGGIVLTLSSNAWLARRQARETAAHAADGVRRALREELTLVARVLEGGATMSERAKADGTPGMYVPKAPVTEIYDALIDQIGRLDGTEISAVFKAYALVKEFPQRVAFLVKDEDPKRDNYFFIRSDRFDDIRGIYSGFAKTVREAIDAMKAVG